MFDAGQEDTQPKETKLLIGLFVVVALIAIGALYYFISHGSTNNAPSPSPAAQAAATTAGPADALHDLKIIRTSMEKDRNGTTAMWSVTIQNRSNAYAYSQVKYETSYIGPDEKPILVNQGVLKDSFSPGEQKSAEFSDALYPAATARYTFKIKEAKSVAE
jgi:hypothetical protein